MTKRYYPLAVGDREFKLRLTMAGQRRLKQQWGEDVLPFLLAAAMDGERLCSLLSQCLDWPESGNLLTDGEGLYDLLVDAGWQGQAKFAALVFAVARVSGLLTADQEDKLTKAVDESFAAAFEGLM